jgi:hypothetical protein
MRKLLSISTVALALVAVSAPRASAWSNFHFGIGMDVSLQGGNNCLLWGAFRSGPAGCETPLPCFAGPWAGAGYWPAFGDGPDYGGVSYHGGESAVPGAQAPSWVAPNPSPSGREPPAKKGSKNNKDDNDQVRTLYPAAYYPQAGYPAGAYGYYAPAYSSPAYLPAPSYWRQ